jgi:hypothetical protein
VRKRGEELTQLDRLVATLLAAVWIAAGLAAVMVALWTDRWLVMLLGPPAIWYGLLWVRVARTGRKLSWPR